MSSAPIEELQPGSRVGPYTIERQIARGGFGTIWQARHEAIGEPVALKVLHPELLTSAAIVQRFEQEARAIAMIRHPNVVELHEIAMLPDGRPYMVMELLGGVNLETYSALHGALPPARLLSILEPVGRALSAAHAQGVVHRDVKASNVVLCERDGSERVVLLDFGIAKLLEAGGPGLTASRVTIGSPACIAPEQIQGTPVSPRTDVYALGVLAFHLLTGDVPFSGGSVESLHLHLTAPRPRPSDRVPLSSRLDDVILTAMAHKPEDRHGSVAAFMSDMRQAVHGGKSASSPAVSSWCLGAYVDVSADPAELDQADLELFDDMESAAVLAAGYLSDRGYVLAYESGPSALYVKPLYGGDERRDRQDALAMACALRAELEGRTLRDPRVWIGIHLHCGEATITGDRATGGALVITPWWEAAGCHDGVFISAELSRGLTVPPNATVVRQPK